MTALKTPMRLRRNAVIALDGPISGMPSLAPAAARTPSQIKTKASVSQRRWRASHPSYLGHCLGRASKKCPSWDANLWLGCPGSVGCLRNLGNQNLGNQRRPGPPNPGLAPALVLSLQVAPMRERARRLVRPAGEPRPTCATARRAPAAAPHLSAGVGEPAEATRRLRMLTPHTAVEAESLCANTASLTAPFLGWVLYEECSGAVLLLSGIMKAMPSKKCRLDGQTKRRLKSARCPGHISCRRTTCAMAGQIKHQTRRNAMLDRIFPQCLPCGPELTNNCDRPSLAQARPTCARSAKVGASLTTVSRFGAISDVSCLKWAIISRRKACGTNKSSSFQSPQMSTPSVIV